MVCPLCGDEVTRLHDEVEQLTLELIRRDHPQWVRADGSCPACLEYYASLGEFGPVDAASD